MPMGQGFPTASILVKNLKKQSEWFHHIKTSMLVQDLIPLVIMTLFSSSTCFCSYAQRRENPFFRLPLSPAPWAFLPHPRPLSRPPCTWPPTSRPFAPTQPTDSCLSTFCAARGTGMAHTPAAV